tara:strand:+ start:7974 stop:8117 length:144 start_codon:yes stop_codon:yes gene_type:complete
MSQLIYKPRVSTNAEENTIKVIVIAFVLIMGLGLYQNYKQGKEETES